ncbi:tetratricopeptide repeat protein [Cylindrospermum stagnale PCC 7417]|uniref:Tetratricopeptide repeat protein n=1 Tax=Cylindrospermum stagnale PCC 7417 TaxID=56107 RepID=K9WX24_9NOST|nr:tetratricopeptide repeat protein [Cylindrospermum stagnale]AFZ24925.1 tetratricopeptide repeat protein [Cylindrospermum stagnale PCC 7417]
MDWINLLRSLQSDFIKRFSSGCLIHSETEGEYSELTIISGERLKALREFCWQMAEKYKRTSPVRGVFINNLKGKLGEEVVKQRLGNFITEVDYEKKFGGDGKIDFTLTANSSIGIEVKSRHGNIDKVRWSVSSEEVEKNAVVVCILIQEEVNEAQPKYHLLLAGFLPTQMIKLRTGKISFGINQLLYGGGLLCYLEQLQASTKSHTLKQNNPSYQHTPKLELPHQVPKNQLIIADREKQNTDLNILYRKLGDEFLEKGNYVSAITNYSQILQVNIHDFKVYNKRGFAYYKLGDYAAAIADYNQAIRINPHAAVAYKNRAEVLFQIGDHQGAIEDYTQAIKINPHYAIADKHGGIPAYLLAKKQEVVSAMNIEPDLEDYEAAIADCTQAIQVNSHDADAYYNRGNAHFELGDNQGAIDDFQKAADLYWKEGKLEKHKDTRARIVDLEIEASLDILNF